MKTTEENNKLIAEFMGKHEGYDFRIFNTGTWEFQTPENMRTILPYKFTSGANKQEYFSTTIFKGYETKFHTSWDWLMPVVQKILVLKNTYGQERQKVFKAITPDIRITYTAVIAFIEWHNAQQPLTN